MGNDEMSKRRAQYIEEREDDLFAWASIREQGDLDLVDARTLIHLGRKKAKRELLIWATDVADEFWLEHRRHRFGDGVPKDLGGYGVRVIEQAWTVTIQWYFVIGRGRGEKIKPIHKALKAPEGKAYRMPPGRFPKAKDWEREAITKAEDEFEKIRRCGEHLKAMIYPFSGYNKMVKDRERRKREPQFEGNGKDDQG